MRRFPLSASTLAISLSVFGCILGGGACSDQTSDAGVASGNKHDGGQSSDDDSGDPGDQDSGRTTTGDGGGPGFSSALSIIVEPSDNGDGLLNAIKNAKTSVHMTMYLLTDNDIVNALVAQNAAGHDVKVILNQTFPSGQGNTNLTDYTTLHSAKASMVVWASNAFTYTHEKCVIIDGKTAWIMTMNASTSAPTSNREYLAVDTDPADVAEAEAIFEADFAHTPITPSGNLLVAPDNDKARLRALIGNATKTLDLEVEELSDYDVVNDIAARADVGVKVRVVLSDETPSSAQATGVSKLKSHGVSLVTVHDPYIHAKAIIVDGTSMYVGSANLTQNSMEKNRELGIVTATAAVIAPVQTAINSDFSAGSAL
ncbi:MAG: phospholipase D-like domain-containing protein [Polyangiaceae bacterium]